MPYCIMKSSRNTDNPHPYTGAACDGAGVPPGKVYDDEAEAQRDAMRLTRENPVGFTVVPYPTNTAPR